eukprot:5099561-Karenia_brevis.AAC.1
MEGPDGKRGKQGTDLPNTSQTERTTKAQDSATGKQHCTGHGSTDTRASTGNTASSTRGAHDNKPRPKDA